MQKVMLTLIQRGLIFFFGMAVLTSQAQAMPPPPELVEVPVSQLIEMLVEKKSAENSEKFNSRFELAQLHGMAYAYQTETATVSAALKHLQDSKWVPDYSVWYGHEPANVPFGYVRTEDLPKHPHWRAHLQEALRWYREALLIAPEDFSARLGYAWCLEKWGEKQKAIQHYRGIIRDAWQKEKGMSGLSGFAGTHPDHPVTSETSGYLLPLLHREKDKAETADLRKKMEHFKRLGKEHPAPPGYPPSFRRDMPKGSRYDNPFLLSLEVTEMSPLPCLTLSLQNISKSAKTYLLGNHNFLRPCELIVKNMKKEKMPFFDKRSVMKYDPEVREEHFSVLPSKAREFLHEATFTRNEDGTYALSLGLYHFQALPAGTYTAQVLWNMLVKRQDDRRHGSLLDNYPIFSKIVTFDLP